MALSTSPIVVIDSGLGGLMVAAAIRCQTPAENILYFGDTARVPYGTKSGQTVTCFVREIISWLQKYHPKQVVIACNTATALALPAIRREFPHLTLSGVIAPGARAAIKAADLKFAPTIAVIATEATVKSRAYPLTIADQRPDIRVLARATPLLVPVIEEGRGPGDPLVQLALRQYLQPLIDQKPDVLVLGCTHYPIYKNLIAGIMGDGCRVIDSAEQCAQDVTARLAAMGIASQSKSVGSLRCFVTDDPGKFQCLAGRFLGEEITEPVLVPAEELSAAVTIAPAIRIAL